MSYRLGQKSIKIMKIKEDMKEQKFTHKQLKLSAQLRNKQIRNFNKIFDIF